MRTLLILSSVLCLLTSAIIAAPDAELTKLLADNATTSEQIVTYADQKAAALVAAQTEVAQLRSQISAISAQLAAEQAARAKAEADLAAARKAVTDAKATVQSSVTALQAAAARL